MKQFLIKNRGVDPEKSTLHISVFICEGSAGNRLQSALSNLRSLIKGLFIKVWQRAGNPGMTNTSDKYISIFGLERVRRGSIEMLGREVMSCFLGGRKTGPLKQSGLTLHLPFLSGQFFHQPNKKPEVSGRSCFGSYWNSQSRAEQRQGQR